jgi:large-conductance mechanosensitive channel
MSLPIIQNKLSIIPNPLNAVSASTNTISKIMVDFNIIGVALGVLIGNTVIDFVTALNDGIMMPSIKPFLDKLQFGSNTDESTSKQDDDSKNAVKFNLSSLVTPLIKFVTISILVLIFLNLGTTLLDSPTTDVVIIGVKPGVKLNGSLNGKMNGK